MLGVWGELEARMITRSTSKAEFLNANREQAIALATQEFEKVKNKKLQKVLDIRSTEEFLDK